MQINKKIIAFCIGLICCFSISSIAADKVVVIPMRVKAAASNVVVTQVTRYLSIPGAGFLPMDSFDPIRRSISTTPNGSIYHSTQGLKRSFIAPLQFPHGAKSFSYVAAAICSPLTDDVIVSIMSRSMVDGTLDTKLTYTLDNANGSADCHIAYGNSGNALIHPIDTESNVYFITVSGLLGQGEFYNGAELDYVRVSYRIDEIAVTD